jgi:predicted RNA methylase
VVDSEGAKRIRLYRTMLERFTPGRLVDLGAGHGLFSTIAADAGWKVTAVDARTERFPDDSRVTWVHEDVRTVDLTGYDLVVCLGLFYHLTVDDQLSLLDRAAGTPMILDTHVGVAATSFPLSDEIERRGYRGRMYQERDLSADTASWENTESFWPTPKALRRMLTERGYVVLTANPWYRRDRTFFLCLPGVEG